MSPAQEILIKCYENSKEAAVIIEDNIIKYANCAFEKIVGANTVGNRIEDVFDKNKLEKLNAGLETNKSISHENVEFCNRRIDVRAFKNKDSTVVLMSDLDAVSQKLRESDESAIAIKAMVNRLSNAITVVGNSVSEVELMRKDLADENKEKADILLKSIKEMSLIAMRCVELIDDMEKDEDKGCTVGEVNSCISAVIDAVNKRYEEKNIAIDFKACGETDIFTYNYRSLSNIVLCLLNQAVNDAKAGDVVELSRCITDDSMKIDISYKAKPLPKRLAKFLCNPQVSEMTQVLEKYGVDLYLARRIATNYDGQMTVTDKDGIRSIIITLPRVQIMPYLQDSGI